MSNIQFLTDNAGNRISAVVPMELFEKLAEDADLDELYEPIRVKAGANDDETFPNEIVNIHLDQNVPVHVAWRIFRGMTQSDVAKALGITQGGVAMMEKRKKPQAATLDKLAALYSCRVTQLYLD